MKTIFLLCCFSWGAVAAQTSPAEIYAVSYQQGIEAINKKDYSSAIFAFQKAGAAQPQNAEAHLRLLQCALEKQDLSAFQQGLEALQKMQYKYLDASYFLAYGQLAKSKQQYLVAIDAAQKGRLYDQKNIDLLLLEASVYKAQGYFLTAIQRLEQASINFSSVHIFNELADAYALKGDALKAIEYYKKTLVLDKKDPIALVALGKLCLEQADKERGNTGNSNWLQESANYYEQYWSINPRNTRVMEILSSIYQTQGNQAAYDMVQKQLLANN